MLFITHFTIIILIKLMRYILNHILIFKFDERQIYSHIKAINIKIDFAEHKLLCCTLIRWRQHNTGMTFS